MSGKDLDLLENALSQSDCNIIYHQYLGNELSDLLGFLHGDNH